MCVIAIKPKNKEIELDTVEDMFTANPHGAGFAVVLKDKTIVSKGYMHVQELWSDISQLQDLDLVLHFRWATHGMINQAMTHPFIVSKHESMSTEIYSETELPVLVHNGILSNYGDKRISDTCDFTINTLARLKNSHDMIKVLKLMPSKFALVDKGKITRIGEFKKYRGLHVSNTDFIQYYKNGNTYNKNKGFYDDEILDGKERDYDNLWGYDDTLLSGIAYSPKNKR